MSGDRYVVPESTASVWESVSGAAIGDHLLEWPPDVFALTDVVLARSEAYRFALSPKADQDWPPPDMPDWPDAVVEAGHQWSTWAETRVGPVPELVADQWKALCDGLDVPLSQLTEGRDWRLCTALLTLHAIADEACAGVGIALEVPEAGGLLYRARCRELLVRTGSVARVPPHLLRVLPKVRTPANGSSVRSLSRYACVQRAGVNVEWHKVPNRRPGMQQPHDRGVNYLLLPWPLRVRESDFHPIPGSVRRHGDDIFGFFAFEPSERLDLDLVDRLLVAALDEVRDVHVVALPENAIDVDEIEGLEAVLACHGVKGLITGVRDPSDRPTGFPTNWVHLGVTTGEHWIHIRQNKHNRWLLDEEQIFQYHLGGTLHPHVRWWEAAEIPRRAVHFLDTGEGATLVALICEDLAQIDDVAEVIRSVGPTIVVTPLLDGPQLSSRWAARYASVLADDPGSAVLTLTSLGMAQRSRPPGESPSAVIALWKDSTRGVREITLEADAQAVLLTASADRATRRTVDGRRPIASGSELFNMSVFQVRAASVGSQPTAPAAGATPRPRIDTGELSVLTSWAEASANALAFAPERIDDVVADAQASAPWRAELNLPEPSARLAKAIHAMFDSLSDAIDTAETQDLDALVSAMQNNSTGRPAPDAITRLVLRSALEHGQARLALGADSPT
ncbi:hypothetical protein ACFPJ1_11645 [Kribbella qitaiheensis]|uniref:hypothetical protein n=1 Tax=Kribbella qitaiheensis TaxID=1544730 RepID=UPI0036088B89